MNPDYPVEYARWWVEFFYQRFQVNESVLIPRLETESLVRKAITFSKTRPVDVLIDIGTGSGIIPLSILSSQDIPQVFALDLSKDALEVAEKNAGMQWKNVTFLESNLLSVLLENNTDIHGKNILIVTNLPYIKQDDWENMSTDTMYEPRLALFWGETTGFELYEKLFLQIEDFIQKYNPASLSIFAEMWDDQNDIATQVLNQYEWKYSFFSDLRGINRFMEIHII